MNKKRKIENKVVAIMQSPLLLCSGNHRSTADYFFYQLGLTVPEAYLERLETVSLCFGKGAVYTVLM
jgi:hypothetical protein